MNEMLVEAEDVNFDMSIIDKLIARGGDKLKPFQEDLADMNRIVELISATLVGKEREVDYLNAELTDLREKSSFLRRNLDETRIAQESMKDSIEIMSNMKGSMADREASNREEITIFEEKFEELKAVLSTGSGWTPAQTDQRVMYEKERDFTASKLENKNNELNSLRSNIDHIYNEIRLLEKDIFEEDKKANDISEKTKECHKISHALKKRKEDAELKLNQMRGTLMKANEELKSRQMKLSTEKRSLQDLDTLIHGLKAKLETYINQYDELFRTLLRSTSELENQIQLNNKIQLEVDEQQRYVNGRKKEIDVIVKEMTQLRKLNEVAVTANAELEDARTAAENKKEEYMRKIGLIRDVEIVAVRRELDTQDKQIAGIKIELEVVKKKYGKGEKANRALYNLINFNIASRRNLYLELKTYEDESMRQKENIRLILQEKDHFDHDVEVANQKYYTSLEELKLQELQVGELQKKIGEDAAKLKHKQNMYDTIRSDRNLYSKQLTDCQEEINTLRRRFVGSNHFIEQLKEETSSKDSAIVKEHFMHHSVTRETELLRNELTKIRKQIESSEGIIANQRVEIMKLTRIIEEAELERTRQNSELASVTSEKNLLTSQVVKRNYELTLLYEKIKAQKSDLRIGESQYNRITDATFEWQHQLVLTLHEHNETVTSLVGLENMRVTAIRLEREILKERGKIRALNDELTKPMNVHRWRVLESSDPKRFEMISTVQDLQKSLVSKSENILKHENLIKEKEKIFTELKNILSRQPGPEIEEQIFVYQQTYKDKIKQLAAMDEELDMYRQQVSLFKIEISGIDDDMKKMKKNWMRTQRKVQNY